MAAPPFVAARVTPEMKTLLRTLAEREHITESALVRQLLQVMLRRSAMEGFPKLDALEKTSRDTRLSIRLAPTTGHSCRRGPRRAVWLRRPMSPFLSGRIFVVWRPSLGRSSPH